jgi:uncharacterized protein
VTSTAVPATRLGSKPMDVAWMALQWPGCEHVIASYGLEGFRADSCLVLATEAGPARVTYQLRCDGWRVAALTVRVIAAGSDRTLELRQESVGRWQASSGRRLPDLDGCTEVDINRSPLTNTLPIRRLGASAGTGCDLDVAYVSVPELTVRPARQRYTQLAASPPVYRYQAGSFSAALPVDGDGLVIDYPSLWRRIGPEYSSAANPEPAS